MVKRREGYKISSEARITARRIFLFGFLALGFLLVFSVTSYQNQELYKNYDLKGRLASERGNLDVFLNLIDESAPVINGLDNELLVCEKSDLNYDFNVTDFSSYPISASLIPMNPFFIIPNGLIRENTYGFSLISGVLGKERLGGVNVGSKTYMERVTANNERYSDFKDFNITIIEINNMPEMDNIGVKTVWTHGEDSVFYYQVIVNDIEDGNSSDENIEFNISFDGIKLFDISDSGKMDFTPISSQIGVYNITVCAKDRGLLKTHENISICNNDGSSLFSCNRFSLTVTDENRKPRILNYSPVNLSVKFSQGENINFYLNVSDPDATLPDIYWYVDGNLKKYDTMTNRGNLSYSYSCGENSSFEIEAIVTDGLLNESIKWNMTLVSSQCNAASGSSSGGGAGGVACTEKWVCNEWKECINLKNDFDAGKINYKINDLIKERCRLMKMDEKACGYQIRDCTDLKKCGSKLLLPGIVQECFYSLNPSCSDGIKNCHNGSCEVLTDCGGPCNACPTCSDGIKNQDEKDIDCGGVCKACIEIPRGMRLLSVIMYVSLVLIIIFSVGTILLILKYYQLRRKLSKVEVKRDFLKK